jgi:hypothetical protein
MLWLPLSRTQTTVALPPASIETSGWKRSGLLCEIATGVA